MTIDFGADINTPGAMDVDPYWTDISGPEGLGQALARRLVTPRGALALIGDDESYGYDVRTHLNDSDPNIGAIQVAIAEELAKDERVESAFASVTFDELASSLLIVATVFTADGPFRLTLDVSLVTVAVLAMEAL